METRRYKYQTAAPVDWSKTKTLVGTVTSRGTFKLRNRQVPYIIVHTADGDYKVLESARLHDAFEVAEIGDGIRIVNAGTIERKGGRTLHNFSVDLWEDPNGTKTETSARSRQPKGRKARRSRSDD